MKVLVEHGTTPTGWGLCMLTEPEEGWIPEEWEGPWVRIAALTPCCGARVTDAYSSPADQTCLMCGKHWAGKPPADDWNICYIADMSENMSDYDEDVAMQWLRGMTGSEALEVEIEWQA